MVSDAIDAFNLDETEKSPRVGCGLQAHERPTSRTWSFGCGLRVFWLDWCMSLKHTCIQFIPIPLRYLKRRCVFFAGYIPRSLWPGIVLTEEAQHQKMTHNI